MGINNDWRDSLKALMPDLPAGDAAQTEEVPEAKAKSHAQVLSIEVDRKRKGKVATIIYGFGPDADDELQAVASELKRRLATGGSARDGEILVQGDRAAQVRELLAGMGYKVKK